jgi:predicted MFS family arabinose efflux permease
LAIRDYRLFVIGNLLSNVGLWTQRVALGWLTWELTHSTAWLGAIAIAESAPLLVFALIAGTVIDRVDYFKLLRCTQSLSLAYAVAMAGLTLAGLMNIWLLFMIVLVRGSVVAFNRPSRTIVLYSLVGRDMLSSAVALNSVIFNVSRFIGPALGGGLIVLAGVGWTFAAAAGLFLVFTLTLHMISARVATPPARERGSMIAEMVDGLRYMVQHRGIRVQAAIMVVIGFLAKPLTDLLPGFVGEVFNRGPEGLAVLTSVYGIGAMAGAFWMVSRDKGVTGLTAISISGILVVAIGLLLFVATTNFWIASPFIAIVGFAFIVQSIANQTLIQMSSEPTMRGRVISNYALIQHCVPAIGALIMGVIADYIGLRMPVAVGAALCLGLWYWVWRERQSLAAVLESEPPETAEAAAPQA